MSEELSRRDCIRAMNDYLRSSSVRNEQIFVESVDVDNSINFLYGHCMKGMSNVEEEK
jgi:hypothetical protein